MHCRGSSAQMSATVAPTNAGYNLCVVQLLTSVQLVTSTCDFWTLKRDSCIKRYPSGVCQSPAQETAPGFSLRGRGAPQKTPCCFEATFRGGAEHACCRPCYGPVRRAAGFAFCQPVQIDDEKLPVNF